MPEFFLDREGDVAGADGQPIEFNDLDEFTQGYIQALFFMNTCTGVYREEFETEEFQEKIMEGTSDGVLPADVGFSDLEPGALAEIIADCKAFQEQNAALLESAYECERTHSNGMAYGPEKAGIDFWHDRVGDGAGFFDRGLGEIGDKLSEACGTHEINPYYENGVVYL